MPRPLGRESRQRAGEVLRLVASGRRLDEAARAANVDPYGLLRRLSQEPEFRQAAWSLLEERAA